MKLQGELPKFRKPPNFWELGNTTGSTSEVSEGEKKSGRGERKSIQRNKEMKMERRQRKKEKIKINGGS